MLEAMRFTLIDRVIERTEQRVVAIKCVTLSEEYLRDHFPGFPVLPGVLMLEALVEAARELAGPGEDGRPLVLGRVRGLKYGRFVPPGSTVRVEVDRRPAGGYSGRVVLIGAGEQADAMAASGRFELRPLRGSTARNTAGDTANNAAGAAAPAERGPAAAGEIVGGTGPVASAAARDSGVGSG